MKKINKSVEAQGAGNAVKVRKYFVETKGNVVKAIQALNNAKAVNRGLGNNAISEHAQRAAIGLSNYVCVAGTTAAYKHNQIIEVIVDGDSVGKVKLTDINENQFAYELIIDGYSEIEDTFICETVRNLIESVGGNFRKALNLFFNVVNKSYSQVA